MFAQIQEIVQKGQQIIQSQVVPERKERGLARGQVILTASVLIAVIIFTTIILTGQINMGQSGSFSETPESLQTASEFQSGLLTEAAVLFNSLHTEHGSVTAPATATDAYRDELQAIFTTVSRSQIFDTDNATVTLTNASQTGSYIEVVNATSSSDDRKRIARGGVGVKSTTIAVPPDKTGGIEFVGIDNTYTFEITDSGETAVYKRNDNIVKQCSVTESEQNITELQLLGTELSVHTTTNPLCQYGIAEITEPITDVYVVPDNNGNISESITATDTSGIAVKQTPPEYADAVTVEQDALTDPVIRINYTASQSVQHTTVVPVIEQLQGLKGNCERLAHSESDISADELSDPVVCQVATNEFPRNNEPYSIDFESSTLIGNIEVEAEDVSIDEGDVWGEISDGGDIDIDSGTVFAGISGNDISIDEGAVGQNVNATGDVDIDTGKVGGAVTTTGAVSIDEGDVSGGVTGNDVDVDSGSVGKSITATGDVSIDEGDVSGGVTGNDVDVDSGSVGKSITATGDVSIDGGETGRVNATGDIDVDSGTVSGDITTDGSVSLDSAITEGSVVAPTVDADSGTVAGPIRVRQKIAADETTFDDAIISNNTVSLDTADVSGPVVLYNDNDTQSDLITTDEGEIDGHIYIDIPPGTTGDALLDCEDTIIGPNSTPCDQYTPRPIEQYDGRE